MFADSLAAQMGKMVACKAHSGSFYCDRMPARCSQPEMLSGAGLRFADVVVSRSVRRAELRGEEEAELALIRSWYERLAHTKAIDATLGHEPSKGTKRMAGRAVGPMLEDANVLSR